MNEPHANVPRPIVVGVDGSQSSKTALAWAARQARLSKTPLLVVTCWQFPTTEFAWTVALPEVVDYEGDARSMLDTTIKEVVGEDHQIELSHRLIRGQAAPALADLSNQASLLVVGCRGHGEFVGMILGSVSEYLTAHAHCPVLVVRHCETLATVGAP
jgi:nucleotide-binding universal stress UspA family protein